LNSHHNQSTGLTVCLLTAGKGSRMGAYTQYLNKALLPLGKKATISRIIEKFPPAAEFVIAVGHQADQVRTYLEMAHPEHTLRFVTVDNYDGPGSGPGYSALCCKSHLQKPFFYVSCDTLWNDQGAFPTEYDWFGAAHVPEGQRAAYCNFEVGADGGILAVRDKQEVSGPQFQAFVGLGFIKNYEVFWKALESKDLINGEHQASNGIRALVEARLARAVTIDWLDTGDAGKYEQAVLQFEKYDFSKPDEALFISNKRVIKFFGNHEFAERRVARARMNPGVFPAVSEARHGFYFYPFVQGKTLYDHCTPEIFEKLLPWLQNELWKNANVDEALFQRACDDFYRRKTEERMAKYFSKYPEARNLSSVNGVPLLPLGKLLSAVPWDRICAGRPVFFHGDFHFDHIVYNEQSDAFCLLDWRQDFAGHSEFGDLYYDLAKFCGALILNYDYIKAGLFQYTEKDGKAWLDFAHRAQGGWYKNKFESFMQKHGFDAAKVRLMIPITFFNMAPLHHYPYDKFLFAFACLLLQQELQEQRMLG
jgi:dTDP-glucose pyrophosphorylase